MLTPRLQFTSNFLSSPLKISNVRIFLITMMVVIFGLFSTLCSSSWQSFFLGWECTFLYFTPWCATQGQVVNLWWHVNRYGLFTGSRLGSQQSFGYACWYALEASQHVAILWFNFSKCHTKTQSTICYWTPIASMESHPCSNRRSSSTILVSLQLV